MFRVLEQVVHIVTTVSQSVRHYDWEGSHRKAFCNHTAARLPHKGPWMCIYADIGNQFALCAVCEGRSEL